MIETNISRNGDKINFRGEFRIADLHRPLALLHQAVQDRGYQEVTLDFRECTAAFAAPMLALCAQAMKLRNAGIDLDLVEPNETKEGTEVLFVLKNESKSFGSRAAGTPIRNKLANLSKMCSAQRVCIDFADVPLVSSSFADEVLGKLFAELGPVQFTQRFELRNTTETE